MSSAQPPLPDDGLGRGYRYRPPWRGGFWRPWTHPDHATLPIASFLVLCAFGEAALGVRSWLTRIFTIAEFAGLVATLVFAVRRPRAAPPRGSTAAARAAASAAAPYTTRSWKAFFALVALPALLAAVCLVAKWRLVGLALDAETPAPFVAGNTSYAALVLGLSGVVLTGAGRIERFMASASEHPARLMVLSFALAATMGGLLLTLPISLRALHHTSFVDGLFTSTSAVCVTGLAVNSIGVVYTPFGQVVILLLVQLGGLGIMVLSAFFAVVAGRKLRARSAAVMAEMIDADSLSALRRSVLSIVVFSLVIELVGALVLFAAFAGNEEIATGPGGGPLSGSGGALWAAVFHSVSAFCNAGFSIFRDGLAPFVGSPVPCLTVMLLIVLGGIGFPVIDELFRRLVARVRRRRPPRLSLHARVSLSMTALLVVGGTLAYLGLEWGQTLKGHDAGSKLLAAAFQSVTTRTAGFNTVDFGAMLPATLMLTMVLMFVGGSSGSAAGGIKTTTLAALVATLWAELRGYEAPRLFGRSLGPSIVRRATGVALLSVGFVCGVAFVLLLLEPHQPLALLFETVSAFATAGLSTGITPELGVPAKLVVSLAMFVGRIGPLTLALAIAARTRTSGFRLPEERMGIG